MRRLLSGHTLAHSLENIYLGARLAAVRPAFTRIYLARAHLTIYDQILLARLLLITNLDTAPTLARRWQGRVRRNKAAHRIKVVAQCALSLNIKVQQF